MTTRWTWLSEEPVRLAKTRAGLWHGFEFQEIQISEEGTCDGATRALHLSQVCGPIQVRAFGRRKPYVELPTSPVVYMPGRHRHGHWRGAQRGLHLFVEPEAFERLTHRALSNLCRPHPLPAHRCIDPLLRALHIDTQNGHPNGPMVGEAVVVAILQQIAGDEPVTTIRTVGSQISTPEICRSIEIIESNISRPLRLEELAYEIGLSVRHFTRVFRGAVGCSPYRYIQQRRVERAKDLICGGKFSLREIASMTGFAHQAHMADTFRKTLGVPPSHFGNK